MVADKAGKEKKEEVTATEANDNQPVEQGLADDIDSAVEAVAEEVEKDRADKEGKKPPKKDEETIPSDEGDEPGGDAPGDKAAEEQESDEGDSDDGGDDDPDDKTVTDELLERAVKAGLSITDAKKFPDSDALSNVCDALEDTAKTSAEEPTADSKDDLESGGITEEMLAAIPDLDPEKMDSEEYTDEYIEVAKGMRSLKDIVLKQAEMIRGLQSSGKESVEAMFDTKVSGLGRDFKKALTDAPDKRAALREQVDILDAGYKAANKDVDPDTVFKQAVAIVLGDVAQKVATKAKTRELQKREANQLSRPGGGSSVPKPDIFEDTADEVDRQFFDKK